jgi:hypothetical protein
MKLVIVHYHLRPGGVRRVIELATAQLARQLGRTLQSVVVAAGEKPDPKWETLFQKELTGTPLGFFIEPAFNYLSEQNRTIAQVRKSLQIAWKILLKGAAERDTVVWAHNLGIGRNLLLTHEVTRACAVREIPLLLHHHDWWFDNRWRRWPEMSRAGFSSLNQVARTIFPSTCSTHHLAINQFDAFQLKRGFSRNAHWLPNLIERTIPPSVKQVRETRMWLQELLNDRKSPVWILPCRALRRKNMAEALLLTRWLRPEAWLVTTGGASSADEQPYFNELATASRQNGWRLRLGILQGDESKKPGVPELLAASEAVLLTSIQEGFGLPYLEAGAARRPLIARSIPNIAPDLRQLGFRFPQYYEEILIDPRLFDWRAEKKRQTNLFQIWRKKLLRPVQSFARPLALLAANSEPVPIPFSRLTLTAQLEILSQPVELSWSLCSILNPFLPKWQVRASAGRLQLTPWPHRAAEQLSGKAYARRFIEIASSLPKRQPPAGIGSAVQAEFLRMKLDAKHLFPLLWSTHT